MAACEVGAAGVLAKLAWGSASEMSSKPGAAPSLAQFRCNWGRRCAWRSGSSAPFHGKDTRAIEIRRD